MSHSHRGLEAYPGAQPQRDRMAAVARFAPHAQCPALFLLALLGLAFGCAERGWLAAPVPEPLVLHADGRWLRDQRNRVVLLRGVIIAIDPVQTILDIEPGREAFRALQARGVNLLRIVVPWGALEPQAGSLSLEILPRAVDPLIRLASAHGMTVVLALDLFDRSPCEAAPSPAPGWACPVQLDDPMTSEAAACAFWRADSFEGGGPLRAHVAELWRYLADHYRDDARVFAFDPIDEPATPACLRAEDFARGTLRATQDEFARSIEATGARQLLLTEPPAGTALFETMPLVEHPSGEQHERQGLQPEPLWEARPDLSPLVLSPHLQAGSRGGPEGHVGARMASAIRAAGPSGLVLFGVVGAKLAQRSDERQGIRASSPEFLANALKSLDRTLTSGAIWPGTDDRVRGERREPAARTLSTIESIAKNPALAEVLLRPFAQRVAGLPQFVRWDPRRRLFHLALRDDPLNSVRDPSVIHLPDGLYPEGFDVRLTPSGRWRFDQKTRSLLIYRSRWDEHLIVLAPRGALPAAVPAKPARLN